MKRGQTQPTFSDLLTHPMQVANITRVSKVSSWIYLILCHNFLSSDSTSPLKRIFFSVIFKKKSFVISSYPQFVKVTLLEINFICVIGNKGAIKYNIIQFGGDAWNQTRNSTSCELTH